MREVRAIPDTGLKCPTCAYNLTAVEANRCPECGTPFRIEKGTEPPDADQQRANRLENLAAYIFGPLAIIVIFASTDSVPPFAGLAAYVVLMSALIFVFGRPYLLMNRYVPDVCATSADKGEPALTLPISFEVQYPPDFAQQYVRRLILPGLRRLIIGVNFAAVLLGGLLVVGADHWALYIALGVVLVLLFYLAQQIYRVYHRYSETTVARYVIAEDGFSYFMSECDVVLPWNAMKAIDEYPEMWLVHVGEGAICLPTHSVRPEVLSLLKSTWQERGLRRVTSQT